MLFAVSYRAGLKSAPAYLVVRQTQRLLHRTTKSTIKRPLTKMNEVEEAIWEIEGASPGPTVVVLGGVHGNEQTGILLAKRLVGSPPKVKQGKLVVALGNPRAIERGTRGSEDHADLNRCFPSSLAEPEPKDSTSPSSYEESRARTLAKYLKQADLLLDIHSTNKPSDPFIRVGGPLNPLHERLFRYFTCEKLLLDPNFVLAGRPVTTDEFVSVCGGTGLCFETGIASEISTVDGVVQIVMSIMAKEMKMLGTEDLEGHSPAEPKDNAKERYIMTECKRLTDSGFRWGEEKGSRNFEFIKRGETIGYEDDGKMPVVAGYDAVLVFPKVPELWKVNSPLYWLARKLT